MAAKQAAQLAFVVEPGQAVLDDRRHRDDQTDLAERVFDVPAPEHRVQAVSQMSRRAR